ncbi:Hypothetical protein PBC10988_8320 [Planctomycetales bacterium 10988]|nr:Hypothetical protein PBC10988_8320 [Planctomycetales bacterium 10988]
MAPLKLHYALAYAVLGSYLPYLPVFLQDQGFDTVEIGWIISLQGFAVVISPTLFTSLADRYQANRLLIGVCYCIGGAALWALAGSENFVMAAIFFSIHAFGYTAMIPLLDGLTFYQSRQRILQKQEPIEYASIRIWGTIGFMIPAVGMFFLLYFTSLKSEAALYFSFLIAFLGWMFLLLLPKTDLPKSERHHPPYQFKKVFEVLRLSQIRTFIFCLFLYSMAIGSFYTFYSPYIIELGIDAQWLGMISNIGVAVELVWMAFAQTLLLKLGMKRIILLGGIALALRFGLLATVPNLWIALGTQLLHGPIVLCLYLIPPMYLNSRASERIRSTVQGCYWMLCAGVARIVGSSLSGYVAVYHFRYVFLLAAICSLIGTVYFLLFFHDEIKEKES